MLWNETLFQFYHCTDCIGLSLHPRLSKEQIEKLYSLHYEKDVASVEFSTEENFKNHGYHVSLPMIRDLLVKRQSILDYGCGFDSPILQVAREKGLYYVGAEANIEVVKKLQNFDETTIFLHVDQLSPEREFDAIFLGDVLEHLTNPVNILGLLSTKLSQNGILMIQGPLENSNSLSHKLVEIKSRVLRGRAQKQGPYHVSLAHRRSILSMLECSGFAVQYIKCYEVLWPIPKQRFKRPRSAADLITLVAKTIDVVFAKVLPSYGNRFFLVATKASTINTLN